MSDNYWHRKQLTELRFLSITQHKNSSFWRLSSQPIISLGTEKIKPNKIKPHTHSEPKHFTTQNKRKNSKSGLLALPA